MSCKVFVTILILWVVGCGVRICLPAQSVLLHCPEKRSNPLIVKICEGMRHTVWISHVLRRIYCATHWFRWRTLWSLKSLLAITPLVLPYSLCIWLGNHSEQSVSLFTKLSKHFFGKVKSLFCFSKSTPINRIWQILWIFIFFSKSHIYNLPEYSFVWSSVNAHCYSP